MATVAPSRSLPIIICGWPDKGLVEALQAAGRDLTLPPIQPMPMVMARTEAE
jgi:hypothetical protein